MASDLFSTMGISASGMRAQSARIKVIAENMANSDTAATSPTGTPYTRKTITFKNVMDKDLGGEKVEVSKIGQDTTKPYPTKYMPDHPGADANGYVKMPNVDGLVETMDMHEAQRSYEANLGMIDQARSMYSQTVDILRH
jgi:flagellar basal-body rod protein FlgC